MQFITQLLQFITPVHYLITSLRLKIAQTIYKQLVLMIEIMILN